MELQTTNQAKDDLVKQLKLAQVRPDGLSEDKLLMGPSAG